MMLLLLLLFLCFFAKEDDLQLQVIFQPSSCSTWRIIPVRIRGLLTMVIISPLRIGQRSPSKSGMILAGDSQAHGSAFVAAENVG